MRFPNFIIGALTAICFASCAGPDIAGNHTVFSHEVSVIGTSARGGEMTKAIVASMNESESCEASVMTTDASVDALKGLNIKSVQASRPENLAKLRELGWDAFLRIDTTNNPMADSPKSVTVTLISTHDPEQVIEFVWTNAWGGMPGSLADASMRKGLADAAALVSDELTARLAASKHE
ncbi:MAG: hypothetical protein ACI9F9_001681 [Candidatus Paceibacteria bacterium]|jgi:hypothetical protein